MSSVLVEELVKFTLQSHINSYNDDDLHLPLSNDFCSRLLLLDYDDHPPHHTDAVSSSVSSEEECSFCWEGIGIPSYPLYKHIASALHSHHYSVLSGGRPFCFSYNNNNKEKKKKKPCVGFSQDSMMNIDDIEDKASQLFHILDSVQFELRIPQPSFLHFFHDGSKTTEITTTSADHHDYNNRIGPGARILFNKCVVAEVQDVRWYPSFAEMLKREDIAKVFPGVKTAEEGVQNCRKLYTGEMERSSGVLVITVSKMASQPYIPVAGLLSELSYPGIQSLLGIRHTIGTIPDGLPPLRSTLLSAFMLPYNPNVNGCMLTQGARALAKHVTRSSDKYWGSFHGSDTDKNGFALDVINRLIANSCWLNVHIVPPHGGVFEIRVAESYGARWSKDGTKFIGFLEPYMEDGHSKGWKH